jgi:CRISPR system Cascade subunit CasD
MVLGLLGSCLGVPRHDADGQAELERVLGVATRTDAEGCLLVDYHTAQAPDGPRIAAFRKRKGFPIATRREELSATFDKDGAPHHLGTQLSQRQYRMDAAFAACVWLREEDQARWPLEALAEHLRCPTYVPFAGRKAAAIALPFEPQLVEAADPVAALRALRFSLDPEIRRITGRSKECTYRWEGDWKGVTPARTETRRDRVASRARWQFLTREEHVLTETKEATHVPEPD